MKITVLNSSETHPINLWLRTWVDDRSSEHDVDLVRSRSDLKGGDLLFLISCNEIINKIDRDKFKHVLIIHASDLPLGRGWSPHIWQILSGSCEIIVTLLEAEDDVDSGDIWHKVKLEVPGTFLYDEINRLLFDAEILLMDYAVENYKSIQPVPQSDHVKPTYWEKRSPSHSQIDIKTSIEEQFNLIRICDPNRFPAFFYKDGRKFILKIEAADE